LPSVVDEPSVFDYAPQHQSTCGLNFNEPVNGGPTFGPSFWASDALVTGYSRGKLFRTKLAKTRAGYVAQNQILAVLNMLAADACVSPRGDLVVAVHGGLPDWGSGPKGKGKLYSIRYKDRDMPQPVLAWASGPQEVRIGYDRPIDPANLRELTRRVSIEYGNAVRPGDRFESMRPGYEVVGRQLASPRFELSVLLAQISPDHRSLLLTTAPHLEASSYAITVQGVPHKAGQTYRPGEVRQVEDTELGYDLSGVEATWTPEGGEVAWSDWLPHSDLRVAREFTVASAEHDRLWQAMGQPGRLTLKTSIDLWQMLRPAVQPGSSTGYRLPDEEVTLTIAGSVPIAVQSSSGSTLPGAGEDNRNGVRITVPSKERVPLSLEIALTTTGGPPTLDLSWTTREDSRPRAFPLRRLLLPWAALERRAEALTERAIPELKGGDWGRGRTLFYGETARCSSCHKVRGRGGELGPDLSNLIHRDYASVYRDIHSPGAAINPDYITHLVALAAGRVLQGAIRNDGDRIIVGDA
jgi:hypothetical protein